MAAKNAVLRSELRSWVSQPAVVHNLRASLDAGSFHDHPVALALVDCITAHVCKLDDKQGWRYTPSADLKLPPECLRDFSTTMLSICKPRGFTLFSGNALGPLTRTVKRWQGPLLMDPTLRAQRVEAAGAYFRAAGFQQHAAPPVPTTVTAPIAVATELATPVEAPSPIGEALEGGVESPLALDERPLAQQRAHRTVQATAAAAPAAAAPATLATRLASLPAEEAPYTAARADAFRILLSSEAPRLYPHVRMMDETRLAQAVLRDHTPEKRLHGFSAMPRIVLLEFVPVNVTVEQLVAWLSPLKVQRRQGKLELRWCRASDEDAGVEYTTVQACEGVDEYKLCYVQLVSYQHWLLALQLDGTTLDGQAIRIRAIEDRPMGRTRDEIDAAFVEADLTHRPKATYSYVEVVAVAYPGIAEVETSQICTNNRYLQVTDLARLHALTICHSNASGILLTSTQTDGDARFRHLALQMSAFILRNATLANRAAIVALRNGFVAEVHSFGFPLPEVSLEDAAHFVIRADSLERWPGASRLGLTPSATTPFYPTLPPVNYYLGLRLKGWRFFAPIVAGLPRCSGSDIYHDLRKLINIAILAMNKLLLVGTCPILFAHFTDVVERVPETGLLHDHLDVHMKQDHRSALMKISNPVIDALETRVPGGRGTAWVCVVGRDWWRAWYDDRLRPLERMQLCLLTQRRIQIWKESLIKQGLYQDSGLSLELDSDAFINTNDMVMLCVMFKLFFFTTPFCAWLFTEYRIECRFEVLRYMIGGSTESALTALLAVMRGGELQRLREALTRSHLGKHWDNRRRTGNSDHTTAPELVPELLDHSWTFEELCAILASNDTIVERELSDLGVDNVAELLRKHSLEDDSGLQTMLDEAHKDLEAARSEPTGPPPAETGETEATQLMETLAATGASPEKEAYAATILGSGERDFDGNVQPAPAAQAPALPADDGFMASGPEKKAARRVPRGVPPSPTSDPNSFDRWERTHVVINGVQMSPQQYINSKAVTQRIKARVIGMGKQAVATQESRDAEVRAAEFKRHTIIAFPFTGLGVEVGRIRQVIYHTNSGFDYINGVPGGLDRDVRIFCDWFVVDTAASAVRRAAQAAKEDARLAALPGAAHVQAVLQVRRRGRPAVKEYLVRWQGYNANADSWQKLPSFASWVNGERALEAYQVAHENVAAKPTADLVYKQVSLPADELMYYELVSKAEVLRSAIVDDSDIEHAIVTLLPEHTAQLARVNASALAADPEGDD